MNQHQPLKETEVAANKPPFPSWPHFDEEEIAAVTAVLPPAPRTPVRRCQE